MMYKAFDLNRPQHVRKQNSCV